MAGALLALIPFRRRKRPTRKQVLHWADLVRELAWPPNEGATAGLASEIVYTGMDDVLIDLAYRMECSVGGRDPE